MNLHSNAQYPFLKYITEEFSGAFYENDFTSLNRILILYHNRHSFAVQRNNISDFLELHLEGLSEPDWFYFYFWGEKRRRIRQVRHRTAFVIRHNSRLLEALLSRKDYSSEQAVLETLENILEWLQTLSGEMVADKALDLDGWKSELELLTMKTANSDQVIKRTARIRNIGKFHELLTGRDQAEKLNKFHRLKEILLEEQWIISVDEADTFRYVNQTRGGRLSLAALYYVLFEKGHIEKKLNAPQIASLFNSWLKHDFGDESFEKVFQDQEQKQFNCRSGEVGYKYVSEARLLLRDF